MSIWVSSLRHAPSMARLKSPDRILSLLSPQDRFPDFDGYDADRHVRISVDDIASRAIGQQVAPNDQHVQQVIAFAQDWEREGALLIHCYAGVSRSSAAAFIVACVLNPRADEHDIAAAIRKASAVAAPNKHIVAVADRLLTRSGRMVEAIGAMSAWNLASENTPYSIPSVFPEQGGHV